MLDDCRAAFHPVATIDVAQAAVVADYGMMDVAADHAVDPAPSGFDGEGALVGADEIDRVLDLELGPLRERPIGKPERSSYGVAMGIEPDRDFVGVVAQTREPRRRDRKPMDEPDSGRSTRRMGAKTLPSPPRAPWNTRCVATDRRLARDLCSNQPASSNSPPRTDSNAPTECAP